MSTHIKKNFSYLADMIKLTAPHGFVIDNQHSLPFRQFHLGFKQERAKQIFQYEM